MEHTLPETRWLSPKSLSNCCLLAAPGRSTLLPSISTGRSFSNSSLKIKSNSNLLSGRRCLSQASITKTRAFTA